MITPSPEDLLREENWLEWRAHGEAFPALQVTELVTTDQTRAEFVYGATMLRLWSRGPRAGDGGVGPSPIQLVIADMLNGGYFLNGVLEPRRTTKTTSIQALMVGRCHYRDDYLIGWTMATTGAKAGERFRKDLVVHMERLHPVAHRAPFDINKGKGSEHIEFPNGSFLNVYAPNGDGFRSGGFDFALVDEAGEADAGMSEDLTLAVLPTMDTKPGAQFVAAGTAAKFREGNLLWDTLEDSTAGVIRHAIPEDTDPDELADWEPTEANPRGRMRELITAAHPGVGWTTPLASVERNYRKFPRAKFLAEYGGIFGTDGKSTGLIPAAHIERAGQTVAVPGVPPKFALAVAVHPDGLWASVGAAWNYEEPEDLATSAWKLAGEDGTPTVQRTAIGLLHWQPGVLGFATRVLMLARKHKVPVHYSGQAQAVGVEIEALSRATPRPTLTPATSHDERRAATTVLKDLGAGTLVYFTQQTELHAALTTAVKRGSGMAGGFVFGTPKDDPNADITPLEACSLARYFLDTAPQHTAPADAMHF